MVRVHDVQRRLLLAGEAIAVVDGDHLVAPAVHDRRRAGSRSRREFLEAGHVERGSQQEHATRLQQRGSCHGNVAAHARADQHQRAPQVLAERQQPRDPVLRVVDAAVIHRLDVKPLLARDLRHRGDLAAPRLAVLAVRKDYVSFGHAALHPVPNPGDIICPGSPRYRIQFSSLTCQSNRSRSVVGPDQAWRRRSTRPLAASTPSFSRRRSCSARASLPCGNAMRPPAATTRCHGTRLPFGSFASTRPTSLARPGQPARSATTPYVVTLPRGTRATTPRIAGAASVMHTDASHAAEACTSSMVCRSRALHAKVAG